ncbi:hypothetical protein, partial [Acinetobacter baumannii]|uniref:hypothetical protein n=1 Tax=Acinetobacter baumannii TaxID=470 RepID=UPI003D04435B
MMTCATFRPSCGSPALGAGTHVEDPARARHQGRASGAYLHWAGDYVDGRVRRHGGKPAGRTRAHLRSGAVRLAHPSISLG